MIEHDIILGRNADGYIMAGGSDHVVLHAKSRSGKSSSFTLPQCLSWPGSMVVLDPKGEAFAATAGYRSDVLGQAVYLYDPGTSDGRTHRWDPFAIVDRTGLARFRQIERLAYAIYSDKADDHSNQSQFWVPAARQAFSSVAMLLAETPGETLTMDRVLSIFMRSDGLKWLSNQVDQRRQAGRPYSKFVADGISDFLDPADTRQSAGIRKSVTTILQSWRDPTMIAATRQSDFDLADLRRRPMTIYVAVNPADFARLATPIRLFFDTVIYANTIQTPEQDPSLKYQTLLLLDEFVRPGKIEGLANGSQYIGGYGLRLAYILQSKASATKLYGEEAVADLLQNCTEIAFGMGNVAVAKEIEERLGDQTVPITTHQRPRFLPWARVSRQGLSDHPHRRPLMLRQEIMQMPTDEELILRPNMPPIRAQKIQWWRDPTFASRVRPPPEIPKLDVEIEADDGGARRPHRLSVVEPEGRG